MIRQAVAPPTSRPSTGWYRTSVPWSSSGTGSGAAKVATVELLGLSEVSASACAVSSSGLGPLRPTDPSRPTLLSRR